MLGNLVPLPSTVTFSEPVTQHPKSDETVAEVAKKLEKKYRLVRMFATKRHEKDIKMIVVDEVRRAWKNKSSQERTFDVIGERIKDLWRKFIVNEETGIKTKASIKRGNQSFIDTGSYFSSMKVTVN